MMSVTNKHIMLSAIMLYVVVPSVIMLNLVMPSVILLNVIIPSVFMLSVVAPHNMSLQGCFEVKVICSYPL
jgi:hypothetical protein